MGVFVGLAVDFILITTDRPVVIFIFAVLPALSNTGPTHRSKFQPSRGRTSTVTTIPIGYHLSPNGVGLSSTSPAFSGSILTWSLEVSGRSGVLVSICVLTGAAGAMVGAMGGVQAEPKTKPSMRAKNKNLISTFYPSRGIWLWIQHATALTLYLLRYYPCYGLVTNNLCRFNPS